MRIHFQNLLALLLASLVFGCDNDPQRVDKAQAVVLAGAEPGTEYKTIEWTDLMPSDDLDALLNPPSYVTDVVDGGMNDFALDGIKAVETNPFDDRYQQALVSKEIKPEMDGANVRIAGYIVPLEFDDKEVTEFFLVPYFGACIHVPPPPPNQLIHVQTNEGLALEEIYYPYWLSGQLHTTLEENDVATSAYSLSLQGYEQYTGE